MRHNISLVPQDSILFHRSLRENIRNLDEDKPVNSLVITSASEYPGAGSSTVAANLSVVTAQANKKVMLIDSDFRRPEIHAIFDLPNTKGLLDLITFIEEDNSHVIQHSEIQGLSIITSGGVT